MVLEYFYPIDSYKIQNGNNWRETGSIQENNIYDVSIKEFIIIIFLPGSFHCNPVKVLLCMVNSHICGKFHLFPLITLSVKNLMFTERFWCLKIYVSVSLEEC